MAIEIWSNSSPVLAPVTLRRDLSDQALLGRMRNMIEHDPEDADLFAERGNGERVVLVKLGGQVFREVPVQPEAGLFDLIRVEGS